MSNSKFLRTNIGPHFLDCLRFSCRQISLAEQDVREWPWTVLGLAALLQSVCVLHLDERDTMQVAALSSKAKKGEKSNQAKTIEALQYDSNEETPKPFMAPPKELLKRIEKGYDAIVISNNLRCDLHSLIDFRNEFTHLLPNSWSIEISGMPRIANSVFSTVEKVLRKPGLYVRIKENERQQAIALCEISMKKCAELGITS